MILRRTKNSLLRAAFSTQVDYYRLFGLKQNFTEQQLKSAYLDLVKKYHPDLSKDPATNQIFKQVQVGYEILANKIKKGQTNEHNIDNSDTTTNSPQEQSIIDQIRDKFYIKFERKDQVNDEWNFSYNLFKKHYEKVQAPKANYQRYQGQGTSNNEYYASKDQKGQSIWKIVIAAASAGAVIGGAYLFTKA